MDASFWAGSFAEARRERKLHRISGTGWYFVQAQEGIALVAGFCYGAKSQGQGLSRGDRYSGAPWVTRSPVLAQHGMVATEQPLASQIAIDILKKGGSAVDAAIAANAALGLMEPVLNGIGGDCFAIVWDPKTGRLYGYNGSGYAPKGRDLEKLNQKVKAAYARAALPERAHIPPVGSLSVTVPGTVSP